MLKNKRGDIAILFSFGVSLLILGYIGVLQLIYSNKLRINLRNMSALDDFLSSETYAWQGYLTKKSRDAGRNIAVDTNFKKYSINGATVCAKTPNVELCLRASNADSGGGGMGGRWTAIEGGGTEFGLSAPMAWTGTNVAIWGGYPSKGAFYDPSNGALTPISATGAPAYGFGYSLVWTGSKLIAWAGCPLGNCGGSHIPRFPRGGIFDPTHLGNGGIYDPTTKNWSPISIGPDTDNALAIVNLAVWTGSKAMFWSGDGNEGALFDPNTKIWSVMAKIPYRDSLGRTTNTGSGFFGFQGATNLWTGSQLMVWGGATMNKQENYAATQEGAIYDPEANSWSIFPTDEKTPSARIFAFGVWTGSKAIFWGGYDQRTYKALNTGAIYDPATKKWKSMSTKNAPEPGWGVKVAWNGKQMIGWGKYVDGTRQNKGWAYNPETDKWSDLSQEGNAPNFGSTLQDSVWTGSKWVVNGTDGCSFFELKNSN